MVEYKGRIGRQEVPKSTLRLRQLDQALEEVRS